MSQAHIIAHFFLEVSMPEILEVPSFPKIYTLNQHSRILILRRGFDIVFCKVAVDGLRTFYDIESFNN